MCLSPHVIFLSPYLALVLPPSLSLPFRTLSLPSPSLSLSLSPTASLLLLFYASRVNRLPYFATPLHRDVSTSLPLYLFPWVLLCLSTYVAYVSSCSISAPLYSVIRQGISYQQTVQQLFLGLFDRAGDQLSTNRSTPIFVIM